MVRIRLQRRGKKKQPVYRIVVTDRCNKREGKVLDILGHYNPIKKEDFSLNLKSYSEWLNQGAQPSNRVSALAKLFRKIEQGGTHSASNAKLSEEVTK